MSNIGI